MPRHDPQLIQWVNDDLRLPIAVTPLDFERNFANGELVAAVLRVLEERGAISLVEGALDGLESRHTTAAKLANFAILRDALGSLGVRCSDGLVADIITEQRGAAASLLLDIKAATTRERSHAGGASARRLHAPALLSVSTAAKRDSSRFAPANAEEAFARQLLVSGMGHKQAAIELRLVPFERERVERERKAAAEAAAETAAEAARLANIVAALRDERQLRAARTQEHEALHATLHGDTLQRIAGIHRDRLSLELTAAEAQRIARDNELIAAKVESRVEVAEFEARLRRLGVQEAAQPQGVVSAPPALRAPVPAPPAAGRRTSGGATVEAPAAGGGADMVSPPAATLPAVPTVKQTDTTAGRPILRQVPRARLLAPAEPEVPVEKVLSRTLGRAAATVLLSQGGPEQLAASAASKPASAAEKETPQHFVERLAFQLAATFDADATDAYSAQLADRVRAALVARREAGTRARLLEVNNDIKGSSGVGGISARGGGRIDAEGLSRILQEARLERAAAAQLAAQRRAKQRAAADAAARAAASAAALEARMVALHDPLLRLQKQPAADAALVRGDGSDGAAARTSGGADDFDDGEDGAVVPPWKLKRAARRRKHFLLARGVIDLLLRLVVGVSEARSVEEGSCFPAHDDSSWSVAARWPHLLDRFLNGDNGDADDPGASAAALLEGLQQTAAVLLAPPAVALTQPQADLGTGSQQALAGLQDWGVLGVGLAPRVVRSPRASQQVLQRSASSGVHSDSLSGSADLVESVLDACDHADWLDAKGTWSPSPDFAPLEHMGMLTAAALDPQSGRASSSLREDGVIALALPLQSDPVRAAAALAALLRLQGAHCSLGTDGAFFVGPALLLPRPLRLLAPAPPGASMSRHGFAARVSLEVAHRKVLDRLASRVRFFVAAPVDVLLFAVHHYERATAPLLAAAREHGVALPAGFVADPKATVPALRVAAEGLAEQRDIRLQPDTDTFETLSDDEVAACVQLTLVFVAWSLALQRATSVSVDRAAAAASAALAAAAAADQAANVDAQASLPPTQPQSPQKLPAVASAAATPQSAPQGAGSGRPSSVRSVEQLLPPPNDGVAAAGAPVAPPSLPPVPSAFAATPAFLARIMSDAAVVAEVDEWVASALQQRASLVEASAAAAAEAAREAAEVAAAASGSALPPVHSKGALGAAAKKPPAGPGVRSKSTLSTAHTGGATDKHGSGGPSGAAAAAFPSLEPVPDIPHLAPLQLRRYELDGLPPPPRPQHPPPATLPPIIVTQRPGSATATAAVGATEDAVAAALPTSPGGPIAPAVAPASSAPAEPVATPEESLVVSNATFVPVLQLVAENSAVFSRVFSALLTRLDAAVLAARSSAPPAPLATRTAVLSDARTTQRGFGGWVLDGMPSCGLQLIALEYACGGPLLWTDAPPAPPSAQPEPPSAAAASAGHPLLRPSSGRSSAASVGSASGAAAVQQPATAPDSAAMAPPPPPPIQFSNGKWASLHAPEGWDGTLPVLLHRYTEGSWVLPRVGTAAGADRAELKLQLSGGGSSLVNGNLSSTAAPNAAPAVVKQQPQQAEQPASARKSTATAVQSVRAVKGTGRSGAAGTSRISAAELAAQQAAAALLASLSVPPAAPTVSAVHGILDTSQAVALLLARHPHGDCMPLDGATGAVVAAQAWADAVTVPEAVDEAHSCAATSGGPSASGGQHGGSKSSPSKRGSAPALTRSSNPGTSGSKRNIVSAASGGRPGSVFESPRPDDAPLTGLSAFLAIAQPARVLTAALPVAEPLSFATSLPDGEATARSATSGGVTARSASSLTLAPVAPVPASGVSRVIRLWFAHLVQYPAELLGSLESAATAALVHSVAGSSEAASVAFAAGLIEARLQRAVGLSVSDLPPAAAQAAADELCPVDATDVSLYWSATWLGRGTPIDWQATQRTLRSYQRCGTSYIATAEAAMRALRTLQRHISERLRRVGRAYMRLLRSESDPTLPADLQTSGLVQHGAEMWVFGVPDSISVEPPPRPAGSLKPPPAGTATRAGADALKRTAAHPIVRAATAAHMQTATGLTNSCFVSAALSLVETTTVPTTTSSHPEVFEAGLQRARELADEGGAAAWRHAEQVHMAAHNFIQRVASDGWLADMKTAIATVVACCAAAQLRHARDCIVFIGAADDATRGLVLAAEKLPTVPAIVAELLRDTGGTSSALQEHQARARLPLGWDEGFHGITRIVRDVAESALLDIARQQQRWEKSAAPEDYAAAAQRALAEAACRVMDAARVGAGLLSCAAQLQIKLVDQLNHLLRQWLHVRNTAIFATVGRLHAALVNPGAVPAQHPSAGNVAGNVITGAAGAVALALRPAAVKQKGGGDASPPPANSTPARLTADDFAVPTNDGISDIFGWLDPVEPPAALALWNETAFLERLPIDSSEGGGGASGGPLLDVRSAFVRTTQLTAWLHAVGGGVAGSQTGGGGQHSVAVQPALSGSPTREPMPLPPSLRDAWPSSLAADGRGSSALLKPAHSLSARGILALATALMDIALAAGGGWRGGGPQPDVPLPPRTKRRGSSGDSLGLSAASPVVSLGGTDGDDVAVAARQLRHALRQAAVLTGDRESPEAESPRAAAAAQQRRSAAQKAANARPAHPHVPQSWQCAPAAWLRAVVRLYAAVPGRDPPAAAHEPPGWSPAAVRAFILALVLSRVRRLPTVQQLVLMARNSALADEDCDGLLTRPEFMTTLMFWEMLPERATALLSTPPPSRAARDSSSSSDRGAGPASPVPVTTSAGEPAAAAVAEGGALLEGTAAAPPPKKKRTPAAAQGASVVSQRRTSVSGALLPEAVIAQGGTRDADHALAASLVVATPEERADENRDLRETLWVLYRLLPPHQRRPAAASSAGSAAAHASAAAGAGGHQQSHAGGSTAHVRAQQTQPPPNPPAALPISLLDFVSLIVDLSLADPRCTLVPGRLPLGAGASRGHGHYDAGRSLPAVATGTHGHGLTPSLRRASLDASGAAPAPPAGALHQVSPLAHTFVAGALPSLLEGEGAGGGGGGGLFSGALTLPSLQRPAQVRDVLFADTPRGGGGEEAGDAGAGVAARGTKGAELAASSPAAAEAQLAGGLPRTAALPSAHSLASLLGLHPGDRPGTARLAGLARAFAVVGATLLDHAQALAGPAAAAAAALGGGAAGPPSDSLALSWSAAALERWQQRPAEAALPLAALRRVAAAADGVFVSALLLPQKLQREKEKKRRGGGTKASSPRGAAGSGGGGSLPLSAASHWVLPAHVALAWRSDAGRALDAPLRAALIAAGGGGTAGNEEGQPPVLSLGALLQLPPATGGPQPADAAAAIDAAQLTPAILQDWLATVPLAAPVFPGESLPALPPTS